MKEYDYYGKSFVKFYKYKNSLKVSTRIQELCCILEKIACIFRSMCRCKKSDYSLLRIIVFFNLYFLFFLTFSPYKSKLYVS